MTIHSPSAICETPRTISPTRAAMASGAGLQTLLELVESPGVALAHAEGHQRRHELEQPAGLGRHDELDARARALVGELPPARRLHRAGPGLGGRPVPGQPRRRLEFGPLERPLCLPALHLVAVG